jgi:hypothetical protein
MDWLLGWGCADVRASRVFTFQSVAKISPGAECRESHAKEIVQIRARAASDSACTINAGFVRIHDAAWTNQPAGSAASADREPAGVSLADVAETTAFNATACLAWREQAIGLREFYAKLQAATK